MRSRGESGLTMETGISAGGQHDQRRGGPLLRSDYVFSGDVAVPYPAGIELGHLVAYSEGTRLTILAQERDGSFSYQSEFLYSNVWSG